LRRKINKLIRRIKMTKRKKDILSKYKIEDILLPRWWEFWKSKELTEYKIKSIGLLCSGADIFDKVDFLKLLKNDFKIKILSTDEEGYCPDCKMIVKTNWFGGAYPESYSVECPHCGFLFAED